MILFLQLVTRLRADKATAHVAVGDIYTHSGVRDFAKFLGDEVCIFSYLNLGFEVNFQRCVCGPAFLSLVFLIWVHECIF